MIRKLCVLLLLTAAALAFGQQSSVIKDIVVTGNKQVSVQAILTAMRTKKGQAYVQSQLDQDKATLEDMGFFEAVDVRAKADDPNGWIINVDVVEYPVIKEIRIVGNSAVSTADILKVLTIQQGQVFNAKSVKPSVDNINALYAKKGFFDRIDEFGPMKESPNTLSISIIEATVGYVKVVGNTRTKDRVMRRLIKTRPGEPWNINKWEADLKRIYGTQWFETVKSKEDDTRELGKVDLTAEVKEAKTSDFGVGLQIDPRSSIAGFVRMNFNNFNGTGQSLGVSYLEATTGGGASVDLTYGNPFIDNHDTSMNVAVYSHLNYRFTGTTFGGGNTPTNSNRYTERRTGASLGFARPLGTSLFGNISGRFERILTSNQNTNLSDAFIQQDGDVDVLTFGLTRNRRDVDIDPARGDWSRISVEPGYSRITALGGANADTSILGSHTFVKENLEFRKYWSPGQAARTIRDLDAPRRVIAFRFRAGNISGKVPFFEQFFVGGSDTVRGYPEDRFWGTQWLATTLEYRHPIQKSFNLVLFADYGGAWGGYGGVNSYTQSTKLQMNFGYGPGLSFKTPLGPIRLDFGFNSDGHVRTHFLIGNSF